MTKATWGRKGSLGLQVLLTARHEGLSGQDLGQEHGGGSCSRSHRRVLFTGLLSMLLDNPGPAAQGGTTSNQTRAPTAHSEGSTYSRDLSPNMSPFMSALQKLAFTDELQ